MKIRTGFVSNSSSSSFAMIGIRAGGRGNPFYYLAKAMGYKPNRHEYWEDNLDEVDHGLYTPKGNTTPLVMRVYEDPTHIGILVENLADLGEVDKLVETVVKEANKLSKGGFTEDHVEFYYGTCSNEY